MEKNKKPTYLFSLLLCLALISTVFNLKAQDPQFHHFYNNALLYNPAYTGNTDLGRFSLGYRNQWPGVPGAFISYTGSYDHYLQEISSGVGLQVVHDKAGSGGLQFTNINALYSYQLRLSRKLALMAGTKVGFAQKSVDMNKFTFADQIARDDGSPTVETGFNDNINYLDIGTGLVFYHVDKFWLGLSFDHINRPNQALVSDYAPLPIRSSVQAGWNFEVNRNFAGRTQSTFTLAALYKAQQKWDQLDLGMYYKLSPIMFGLWYRGIPVKSNEVSYANHDAIILMFGFEYELLTFAYSYDITLSPLAGSSHGAHEISLILEYPKTKRRSKRYYRIPCPKF